MLGKRQPALVVVCSLLDRPQLRLVDLPLRYRGFEVDDQSPEDLLTEHLNPDNPQQELF